MLEQIITELPFQIQSDDQEQTRYVVHLPIFEGPLSGKWRLPPFR